MKRLKNKIFTLLVSIFTSFLIIILLIFNVSIYSQEYDELEAKIDRVTSAYEDFNFRDLVFVDLEVYIVSRDAMGNLVSTSRYTGDNGLSEQELINLVNKNLDKFKLRKIGNLYFNKHIFTLSPNGDLIVVNNTTMNKYLTTNLSRSILIFVILEFVIIYISKKLTKWLTRPVQETFDRQKRFVSDASHELKTPLSIIMASAETLESNPKEKKWLENIKSESERMNKLVMGLLDLSKTEEGTTKEKFRTINLSKIMKTKALSFESLMFENDLELKLDIEKDISYECDQDQMKELLGILLDNAIKHGYEKTKIIVTLRKNKDAIILSVTNRGDVIPKSERVKIFERFYRGDESRNRSSERYGLGLAIAKNIVKNYNGDIFVDCKNGYTTFTVELK